MPKKAVKKKKVSKKKVMLKKTVKKSPKKKVKPKVKTIKAPTPVKISKEKSSQPQKAPRWYLYLILLLNLVGVFFMFTLNQFGDAWMVFVTVADFMIGITWFVLNIILWTKFRKEGYEKKALAFPIYYVFLYVGVYMLALLLSGLEIVLSIYFFYWLTIITAVLEIAYAEFLLKDIRASVR